MADATARRPWSLEKRLRAELTIAMIAIWVLAGAGSLVGLWRETGEVLDSALAETAQRLLAMPDSALGIAAAAPVFGTAESEQYTIYQVFDGQGRLLLRSHAAPDHALDVPGGPVGFEASKWRFVQRSRPDGSRRVLVAESTEHRHEVLWSALAWLIASMVALLAGTAWVLQWLLRRAFSQIEVARRQLASRAAQDLQPVDGLQMPLEMQPWIGTINELIDKVRDLVQAERSLAAQTAHELRTPLAAARAQAQRLIATSAEPGGRSAAASLVRQLDRLARMCTRLLQLARIESGVPPKSQPVDLAALAALVADEFSDARASGRLRLEMHDAAAVDTDLDLLGIALRNLVDNALKHAGPEAQVRIEVTPRTVSVTDDGPGVVADAVAGLIRPFERGRALSEGSGLGLAIVERIVGLCGASLSLKSPVADGRGFAATIRFAP
jgi:two-component system, OmpR family, sensor kinase